MQVDMGYRCRSSLARCVLDGESRRLPYLRNMVIEGALLPAGA
jgi:hypothetical protein